MLKLTNKNYENLPEIKKRKELISKKDDLKKRMQNVKELEKKRRETLWKKKTKAEKDDISTQ